MERAKSTADMHQSLADFTYMALCEGDDLAELVETGSITLETDAGYKFVLTLQYQSA